MSAVPPDHHRPFALASAPPLSPLRRAAAGGGGTRARERNEVTRGSPDQLLMSQTQLELYEQRENGTVRLSLLGELDLASAPALENRLNLLRAQKRPVRLDLSKLEFIDSTGIELLLRTLQASRQDGWELGVDHQLSPQVQRVLTLINLKDLILGDGGGRH